MAATWRLQQEMFLRKVKSLLRFYARRKHLADLTLAVNHACDLARLYFRRPNEELAYYNLLFTISLALSPRIILELGTGPGLSSIAFIRALQYLSNRDHNRPAVLHTCDMNPASREPLRAYSRWAIHHIMTTNALATQWAVSRTPIDLLYIDADHSH